MRTIIELNIDDLTPTPAEVLANQGMGGRANLPEKIKSLLDSALQIYRELATPRGLLEEIAVSGFDSIYQGNGMNSSEGPVPTIASRADGISLFAATLGDSLIAKSNELFAKGGPALGFMLDAVNSSGAERLGRQMGLQFLNLMPAEKRTGKELKVQYYCPGHCGWHISGQEKLFATLHPEEIGMSINSKWVMHPFKSISGILAVGEMDIHRFQPSFSFCKDCKEHKCVKRLLLLENEN
jgi:hypothetical protein